MQLPSNSCLTDDVSWYFIKSGLSSYSSYGNRTPSLNVILDPHQLQLPVEDVVLRDRQLPLVQAQPGAELGLDAELVADLPDDVGDGLLGREPSVKKHSKACLPWRSKVETDGPEYGRTYAIED